MIHDHPCRFCEKVSGSNKKPHPEDSHVTAWFYVDANGIVRVADGSHNNLVMLNLRYGESLADLELRVRNLAAEKAQSA